MAYKDPNRQLAAARDHQRRRRAAMSAEARRAEWREQQQAHRNKPAKRLHPHAARSVSLRTCEPLEHADVAAGRAFVGTRGLEHDQGFVDDDTAPPQSPWENDVA